MIYFTILLGFLLIVYLAVGLAYLIGLFMSEKNKSPNRPFVSIIIAARNEENNIAECLENIVRQTYPADKWEVIVVDDRSRDGTGRIIENFASRNSQIKWVRVDTKPDAISGKKNALDHGIRLSKGEILLFTDADCHVKETWVEGMVSYFTENVGAVIGFSSIRSKSVFERWQEFDFVVLMAAACGAANLGYPLAASGQNLAYRRSAFDRVGGFEKVKHRISGDDTLMIQLIRKLTEYQIVFATDPGTFTTTQPMYSLSDLVQQRSRWASNGTIMPSLDFPFFAYLVSIYLLHTILLAGLIFGLILKPILIIIVFSWITKGVIDFSGSYVGTQVFKKRFSMITFLMWFVLQTPFVVLVGLRGMLGLFKWK